ncbi:MAG: hypothetical protein QG552_3822 [Thermodesulfobacteriota bacterium]|nr:hypothetical protein [Thermodesulfobacteriota bacterium]
MSKDGMNGKGQKVRLQRFGMATVTYALVSLAAFLVTRLDLGEMTPPQWLFFLGLGVFINCVFFILFYTNANLRFSDPSLTREQIVFSTCWGMVPLYLLPEARPIVLMFYVPAFTFGILRLTRNQYFAVVAIVMGLYASLLGLEYWQHPPQFRIQYQLFLFIIFGILLGWIAFFGGFVSSLRRRLRLQHRDIQSAHEKIQMEMEERKRAEIEKDHVIAELKDALQKVKLLSGMLPICASCKKIRDDQGYWTQIEAYIRDHSEAEFSHGICPECMKKLYPEFCKEDSELKTGD